MTFGETIRNARKNKRWSLRQLAEEMDKIGARLDFTYLSRVENDAPDYPLGEEKMKALAQVLGLDEADLFVTAEKVPTDDIIKAMKNDKEFAKHAVAFFRKIKKDQHDK